ncbi:protein DA1-related 5-like [Abrus precatorius]|uniref:Protein DA1-related 5-like n=1 Tax=Abrus precatorius TaxID=3816 RepID=A0A8B8KRQ9_ABRPR|nr:protein DA1-related 5-like [Abrus precatorius]
MAMDRDTVVRNLVGELLSAVLETKERAVKFRPTLEHLEGILKAIEPSVNQIDLDRPAEEIEKLMKSWTKLVLKGSKIKWWNCCYVANYQEELEALDENIKRLFALDMLRQIQRNSLEPSRDLKEIHLKIRDFVPRKTELRGLCSPPEPPAFTVGLEVPLMELKLKFLQEQVSVSVVTITGIGGSGKSTLAKVLCSDQEVKSTNSHQLLLLLVLLELNHMWVLWNQKLTDELSLALLIPVPVNNRTGKFKQNIFFITVGKTPNMRTIAQRLFEHNGYDVPELRSPEDAYNKLEHLLKEIGRSPVLVVFDDVWPGFMSLLDNFLFPIPNYTILVTSRFAMSRFGPPYVLKPPQ